jgi:hypothetical protein
MELLAALAERVLITLIRAGGVAVERYRDVAFDDSIGSPGVALPLADPRRRANSSAGRRHAKEPPAQLAAEAVPGADPLSDRGHHRAGAMSPRHRRG